MRECNNCNIKCVRNTLKPSGKAQGRVKDKDYLQRYAEAGSHWLSRADCAHFFPEMSNW